MLSESILQICANLRTARERSGLSLYTASNMAHMQELSLQAIERGDLIPRLNQVERLAGVYGVPFQELLRVDVLPACGDDGPMPRSRSCRYAFPSLDGSATCRNKDHEGPCGDVTCNSCGDYDCRYIQYPLAVSGIDIRPMEGWNLKSVGNPVAVRPCGDELGGKTYLGIYLGEQPWLVSAGYDRTTGRLSIHAVDNPMIYIPEIRRIVRGADSWWQRLETVDDLKAITDEDIRNVWYVRMLTEMLSEKQAGNK